MQAGAPNRGRGQNARGRMPAPGNGRGRGGPGRGRGRGAPRGGHAPAQAGPNPQAGAANVAPAVPGHANVAAPVVAAAAPPTRVASISEAAGKWRPKISGLSKLASTHLKARGILHDVDENRQPSGPHEASHAVRDLATVKAMGLCSQTGPTMVSVFGSDRDVKLMRQLNRISTQQGKVIVHGGMMVAQDINRRVLFGDPRKLDVIVAADAPTSALIVHVYCGDAMEFAKLIDEVFSTGITHVYWVGHSFRGALGSLENEGAWVRQLDGKIRFRSDAQTAEYPPHWDAAALACAGSYPLPGMTPLGQPKRMAVAPIATVGDTIIVHITPCAATYAVQTWTPKIDWLKSDFSAPNSLVKYYIFMLWPWLFNRLGFWKKPLVVDMVLLNILRTWLLSRARDSFTFRQMSKHLQEQVDCHPELRIVALLFPGPVTELVHATALHAFTVNMEQESFVMSALRATTAAHNLLYNESIAGFDKPKSGWPTQTTGYGLGAVVAATTLAATWFAFRPTRYLRPVDLRRLPLATAMASLTPPSRQAIEAGLVDVVAKATDVVGQIREGANAVAEISGEILAPVMEAMFKQSDSLAPATMPSGPIIISTVPEYTTFIRTVVQAQANAFGLCVAGPIAEEWVKRYVWIKSVPVGFLTIVGIEVASDVSMGNYMGIVYRPLAHGFMAALPFKWGCLVHMWWNWNVLVQSRWLLHRAGISRETYNHPDYLPHVNRVITQGLEAMVLADGHSPAIMISGSDTTVYGLPTANAALSSGWYGVAILGLMTAAYAWFSKTRKATGELWRGFKRAHYEQPWGLRPAVGNDPIASEAFSPADRCVPRQRASFPPKDVDETIPVVGVRHPRLINELANPVHMLLPTSQPVYAPLRDDTNLYATVDARILVPPPMDPVEQYKVWLNVAYVVNAEDAPIIYACAVIAWFLHIKDDNFKYKRALAAYERLQKCPVTIASSWFKAIQGMVKADEVLMRINDDGEMELKPRFIAEVAPEVQVTVGPYVYAAQKRLYEQWDGHTAQWVDSERILYLVAAGGHTADDLSDWANILLPGYALQARLQGKVVAVSLLAGDDRLAVAYRPHLAPEFDESDYGMFDSTQSWGPLLHELHSQAALGVPAEICLMLLATTRATYRVADQRIKLRDSPKRPTGGANTSSGNTIVNGSATVHAYRQQLFKDAHLVPAAYEAAYTRLGFVLKLKVHKHLQDTTFLKGTWWVTVHSTYEWGPLPSRVLKAGKSLHDPNLLFPKVGIVEAARRFLAGIANNYARLVQVPILRAFVQRYVDPRVKVIEQGKVKYKVRPGSRVPSALDEQEALAFCWRRYRLSAEVVYEVEQMILKSAPFTFLSHPVFTRLAQVDYN